MAGRPLRRARRMLNNPDIGSPSPLVPGIIVTFAPQYSWQGESVLFYPASLSMSAKGQMQYPGDRPGRWVETPYIAVHYRQGAKEALENVLHSERSARIEVVTPRLERMSRNLEWLETRAKPYAEAVEVHAGDVPEHVRNKARMMRNNPSTLDITSSDLEPDATYAFLLASGESVRARGGSMRMNQPVYIDGQRVLLEGRDEPETWTQAWRTGLSHWTSDPDDLVGAHVRINADASPSWMSLSDITRSLNHGELRDALYWTNRMPSWKRLHR